MLCSPLWGSLCAMLASPGCPCSLQWGGSWGGQDLLLLGCCCPAWVPCPGGVYAPISFHICEKQLGIPGMAKGVAKCLERKGDLQHLSARSWVVAL